MRHPLLCTSFLREGSWSQAWPFGATDEWGFSTVDFSCISVVNMEFVKMPGYRTSLTRKAHLI